MPFDDTTGLFIGAPPAPVETIAPEIQILTIARDLIAEPNRWIQYELTNHRGNATLHCAVGAIHAAARQIHARSDKGQEAAAERYRRWLRRVSLVCHHMLE